MPLYEYECDANGHRFEMIRKFSDPPLESCPQCGSPVHKLFSSPAIQFKGSGFYITDYPKKGNQAGEQAAKDKDSGNAGKSGAEKSDTAAKTEKADSPSTSAPAPAPAPPAKAAKSDS